MATVYIVTAGSYSDYRIKAVFSTRELASQYIEATRGGCYSDEPDIEEWDLDPEAESLQKGYRAYFGRIDREGNVVELSSCEYSYSGGGRYAFDVSNNLYMNVLAEDANHARKILAEKHAEVLASGQWRKK